MTDDLIEAMTNHFSKDDIRRRFDICSEFSIVEQWFRMEIYLWIRQELEDRNAHWSCEFEHTV
ncbi:MAG: hypothetical protein ACE5QF_09405 [Thermoplasmata archaeon]